MCNVKRYVLLFVVFASLCISGCDEDVRMEITSAEPDPGTVIYADPGDNIVFSVDGVFSDFYADDFIIIPFRQWDTKGSDNYSLTTMNKRARLHVRNVSMKMRHEVKKIKL